MKKYKLIKNIDSIVLLCSEKNEFETLGYNYTEHCLVDNIKVLENTDNGRCIEFSSSISAASNQDHKWAVLSDALDRIEEFIVIHTDEGTLYFNARLTRRKSKIVAYIKYYISEVIKGKLWN